MVFPMGAKLNEDPCPVTEQLFGELRSASHPEAIEIAKTLPESQRARLATFFYNKSHLHALGLMIASTCNRGSLVHAGKNRCRHVCLHRFFPVWAGLVSGSRLARVPIPSR